MGQATAITDRTSDHRIRPEGLIAALGELRSEGPAQPHRDGRHARTTWPLPSALSREDERFVAALRTGLEGLLGAAPTVPHRVADDPQAALDGAEFAIREDIARTRGAGLPRLLPALVFLALMRPFGEDEALRVSARTAGLLEAEAAE